MNKEQRKEIIDHLIEFTKRASSINARPEEIAILPAMYEILFGLLNTTD